MKIPDEFEGRAAPEPGPGWTRVLLRFVEEIVGSADSLVEVTSDRIRLSVRRTIVRVAIGAGAAVCAAVWLGAAALAVLRGVCGGFAAAFGGREWLGDLTGGLFALALTAVAVAIHLRLSSRRELRRLMAKYERIRNEHGQHEHVATPARSG